VLLVGTKIDRRKEDDSAALPIHGHALARDIGAEKYVECSSFTQQNLTTVFEEAARIVMYPSSGNKIKKKKTGAECCQCKVM
jgi:Ras-related C3 botulinum toxin substrate 1